ncbi:MAG: hypothetical protein NT011_04970 [Kiritimatiellaeota bacterium]|nr:hypothetical protein [Kiritimatiellota bacterium]
MKKQAVSANKGASNNIWSFVKEDFDEKLPRRTAVFIKEEDYSLTFAYPANFGSFGWNLDNREETTYDESPIVTLAFGDYSFPDLTGKKPARNTFYFNKMEYFPSLVRREVIFSNFGLEVQETFCQSPQGGFCWHLDLTRKDFPHNELNKKLYAVVTFDTDGARLKHRTSARILELQVRDKKFYLVSEFSRYGFYKHFDDFLTDLSQNRLSNKAATGKYLILEYAVRLKDMEMKKAVRFGMSFQSRSNAVAAFTATGMADKIRDKWNRWFSTLPTKKFLSSRDKKAYYKCWWVVRLNYLKHTRWGKVVLEAFPVYRGFWQWSIPAAEWHSRYNPEIGPAFLKKLMDLFLEYQRPDGYVTHAIYLDEKVPGERWEKSNIIQTPHLPWVALRYFNVTQDVKSLKSWYPRLVKYYHYINDSRDKNYSISISGRSWPRSIPGWILPPRFKKSPTAKTG